MPLYEYLCDACGRRFELIRKFSDPPLEACPSCGGTVRKQFASPAIQFKGSGFYITDYAKKDQSATAKAGTTKADGSSKTEAGKTENAKSDTGSAAETKTEKKNSAGESGSTSTSAGTSPKSPPAKDSKS